MRPRRSSLGCLVISSVLLACSVPATGARVSSGLLADLPELHSEAVEIRSRAAEAASRRLQQEPSSARLLPPNQLPFVVSPLEIPIGLRKAGQCWQCWLR